MRCVFFYTQSPQFSLSQSRARYGLDDLATPGHYWSMQQSPLLRIRPASRNTLPFRPLWYSFQPVAWLMACCFPRFSACIDLAAWPAAQLFSSVISNDCSAYGAVEPARPCRRPIRDRTRPWAVAGAEHRAPVRHRPSDEVDQWRLLIRREGWGGMVEGRPFTDNGYMFPVSQCAALFRAAYVRAGSSTQPACDSVAQSEQAVMISVQLQTCSSHYSIFL